MAKIAFFNVPAYGHILPTLPVLKHLTEMGHDVTYFASEQVQEIVEATGAKFAVVPQLIKYDPSRMPPTLLHLADLLIQQSYHYLPMLVEELKTSGYDAVVHDSVCPWGRFGAEKAGLPAICSVTPLAMTEKSAQKLATFWDTVQMILLGPPAAFRYMYYRSKFQKKYGIPANSLYRLLTNYSSELNIVFTSRTCQPHVEEFGNEFRFVGASLLERSSADALPMDELEGKRVVYVSLGTVVDDAPEFYRSCMRALSGVDAHVIMSVGRKVDVGALGDIPKNFWVRSFIPQIDVLKRADVFISHAGLASISESLCHGVPMLFFPKTPEQAMNARMVIERGAGRMLRKSDVTPERLPGILEEAISSQSMKDNAEKLGKSLRDAGGPQQAAREIDAHLAKLKAAATA